ncbi:MAG: hypothetical protein UX04_C0002G0271 [Microgenomates group bacterium GW2011_GWF2_45_18]|nr:MAG: hypothetical protein UW18_C0003G0291 [Microgenomates group bacterium GW2011_GWF1_44_10]KKU02128.1 MAG: hypothetical protein UX04_C0002G0271 [Microgenomates group bacterium GW2011_GWF2_45_18]OGJ41772.1 MAG: hypothetical protein A2378_00630 [Candidatus Pacebacteria bacterium RIFOXYB1_FULL_44_10]HAU98679.1 hypothetical protein [Candidatus Paceibacterota bacterium]HAX01895.1 hypothetical protein [Candidatus Paceibacterota bacterium]
MFLESSSDFIPPYTSELGLLYDSYRSRLEKLLGGSITGQLISLPHFSARNESNRAIRVRTREQIDFEKYTAVCFCDHDDTLERYSPRKESYVQELCPMIPSGDRDACSTTLRILNAVCRIRPITGKGPDRYSPLLEMIACSTLLDSQISALKLQKISDVQSAKEFIIQTVLPQFAGMLEYNERGFFREVKHQALAIQWDTKPSRVAKIVWDTYRKHMTQSTIPDQELAGLNIDPAIYWIITTYGEIGFQPEKVINALEYLQTHSYRMPNELLFLLRGTKEPVVSHVLQSFPETIPVLAIDDRLDQLEQYRTNPRIVPIQAKREIPFQTRNDAQPDHSLFTYPVIQMDQGNFNEKLVKIVSSLSAST